MKSILIKFSLILLVSISVFQKTYSGQHAFYIQSSDFQKYLPYDSRIKFTATAVDFNNGMPGSWLVYVKCNNPSVSLNEIHFQYNSDLIINKRSDGFYKLPDMSYQGSQNNIELAVNYSPLSGTDSAATFTLYLYYIGHNQDSVKIRNDGLPYQYYSLLKDSTTINKTFLSDNYINFSSYVLSSSVQSCDSIHYSLKVKGYGYSAFNNFSITVNPPSEFSYIPHTSSLSIFDKNNVKIYGPILIEPTIINDSTLFWNTTSLVNQKTYLKNDTTRYLIINTTLLSPISYAIDSILGFISSTNKNGSVNTITPSVLLYASSIVYPSTPLIQDTTLLVVGDSLLLYVTNIESSPVTYSWMKNNVPIVGARHSTLKISNVQEADSGSYRCIAYNQCHFVSSDYSIVKISTPIINSVSDKDQKSNLQNFIYPNPNNGVIFFNSDLPSSTYKITNLSGALICEGKVSLGESVNIQEIPNGLYFIHLSYDNQVHSIKLFKY